MCASALSIAFWWRLGIIMLSLLCLVSIFKTIYSKVTSNTAPYRFSIINQQLTIPQHICLWSMIAYWILYAVSALFSNNHDVGWSTASIKLYFLVLPLLCLIGDTSYLTSSRIKALFQIFTASLMLRFVICLVISGISLLQGASLAEIINWQTDPLGMHHNYLALYINVAIAYLYFISLSTRKTFHSIAIWACASILIVYMLLISSRSGLVTLAILVLAILVRITFFRKKFKTGLIIGVSSILLLVALYLAVPSLFSRFATLTQWDQNHYPDDRVIAWICGINATEGHLLFGHGSGDYMQALNNSFEVFGYQRAINEGYNSHCQYIETILETGIIGLIFFLVMLFSPFIASQKRSSFLLTMLTILVVASMNVFEVMFNRQMGTQLIASLLCLLIISMGITTSHDNTCQIDNSHHN